MTGAWARLRELAMQSEAVRRANAWRRESRVVRQPAEGIWSEGIEHELAFWRDQLHDPDWDPKQDYRLDPDWRIQEPEVVALLDDIGTANVSLLDVGSGPLTTLGKTHPGKTLSVTATDPLADEYNEILREAGIEPPSPALACRGEDLLDRFAPGTFDIVFARNALDHSIDPVRVIENMVALTKDGGHVVLRHRRCEARVANYVGLHQWNFDIEGDAFVLHRGRRERVDINRRLAGIATVEAEGGEIAGYPWVICVIEKRREGR